MLPRMLRLHPSTYQRLVRLSKEAEKEGAYRVAKRLRAVLLNAEGYTSGELAELLQSPRSKVSEWLQRYQSDGVDGLLEGYRSAVHPNSPRNSNNSWEISWTAALSPQRRRRGRPRTGAELRRLIAQMATANP